MVLLYYPTLKNCANFNLYNPSRKSVPVYPASSDILQSLFAIIPAITPTTAETNMLVLKHLYSGGWIAKMGEFGQVWFWWRSADPAPSWNPAKRRATVRETLIKMCFG